MSLPSMIQSFSPRQRAPFMKTMLYGTLACLCLVACDSHSPSSTPQPKKPTPVYQERGDLPEIRQHGYLRVLTTSHNHLTLLPRQGLPQNHEFDLLETFAEAQELRLVFIPVKRHDDLIPYLLEGKGDLIANNFSATASRKSLIAFSLPIDVVNEEVITRANDSTLSSPSGIKGRTITIRRSSAFWDTVQAFHAKHPDFQVKEAPEHLDTEQILDGVAEKSFDLTVADSNTFEAVQLYASNLRRAFTLTQNRPIAWGVRPTSQELLRTLNSFLNELGTSQRQPLIAKDDLPGIHSRKILRVLTRNNPATYFLWQGQLMGFDYELAKHFAKQHALRAHMVVPPARSDLIPWLLEGKGDLIAASLTISEKRAQQGLVFSHPYLTASEIVVTRSNEPDGRLQHPKDLAGRTVAVRRSSNYWETLHQLQKDGIALTLLEAPEDLETEEIIAKVAGGEFDLTVADSHILDMELTWREDIRAAFPLGDPRELGWAMRRSNSKLLHAVNQFMKKEYRGLFYNMTVNKYFKNSRYIRRHTESRTGQTGSLSPYDELARQYAKQYGFDWRLIVAQMYQESRFNPDARSWAGALGLMQVLPRTAKSLGFKEVTTPEHGVEAGVKYLDWVRQRFDSNLPVDVRTWFALAGYNAGPGHVHDAQQLARKLGMNPSRWFGHVEEAIKLLAKRKYARKARHGYCRGTEPVKYVREIKERYEAYQQVLPLTPSPS